jgi:SAM-dependent methyltransferase
MMPESTGIGFALKLGPERQPHSLAVTYSVDAPSRGPIAWTGVENAFAGAEMNRKMPLLLIVIALISFGAGMVVGTRRAARGRGAPSPAATLASSSRPIRQKKVFPESALAHKLLDGLRGIEIGGSAHNSFGLNTLNVDYTDDYTTVFKKQEIELAGECMKVDIVASGDQLPFKENTLDFVISSHVIEHFYDPVKTIEEWLRVVKPGGYVFIIAPHRDRIGELTGPRTLPAEIIARHERPNPPEVDDHRHYSCWQTQDFVGFCRHYGWKIVAVQDVDDKVGNGFTVVIQKAGLSSR